MELQRANELRRAGYADFTKQASNSRGRNNYFSSRAGFGKAGKAGKGKEASARRSFDLASAASQSSSVVFEDHTSRTLAYEDASDEASESHEPARRSQLMSNKLDRASRGGGGDASISSSRASAPFSLTPMTPKEAHDPLSLAKLADANEAMLARIHDDDEPLTFDDRSQHAIATCADICAPRIVDQLRERKLNDVRWLKIERVAYENWHRGHSRLVRRAVAVLERQLKEPGLLEIVVNFGRLQLVERVLHAPKLVDERSPLKLQTVLSTALRMAAADRSFDLNVITVLLQHGAKVSDVWLTGLFDQCSTPMRSVQDVLDQRQASLEQKKNYRGRGALPLEARDEHPWANEFALMLDMIIPGFRHYANERNRKREPVSAFDLMCWAICCGATKLAVFMWRIVESSPLRAALIGQQLCERFRIMEYNLDQDVRHALKTAESEFNDANRALLSSIISQKRSGGGEEAKRHYNEMIREIIYPDVQLADELGLIHGKNPNWVQRLGRWLYKRLDERNCTRGLAKVFEPPMPAQRRLLALAIEFRNEQVRLPLLATACHRLPRIATDCH